MRSFLFAATMFLAAALSFLVQPMVGKLLLPLLGGTPSVWNTCLVFFQATLLLGYLYAHQPAVGPSLHLAVLALPAAAFALGSALMSSPVPIAAAVLPTSQDNPILPVLAVLLLAVGVPFAVLASTAPLLQRWHGGGEGAYSLYAASNAGSLVGLLGYPLVIEPWLPLPAQQWGWAAAALACLALTALCALQARELPRSRESTPGLPERLTWMALAAAPSALLVAVSTVLTTEVAPVPLLWVVPLALYLVSFIVVFSWWPGWARQLAWRGSAPLVLFVMLILMTRSAEPLLLVSLLHLGCFFLLCLTCHGELVARKPPAEQLTSFYLSLSAGGVLGGMFAALAAPVLFARAGLWEYPLTLALATLARPPRPGDEPPGSEYSPSWLDLGLPLALGAATAGLIYLAPAALGPLPTEESGQLGEARAWRFAFQYAAPLAAAFAMAWRPWRLVLALLALFAASHLDDTSSGKLLYFERNFFGSLRVERTLDGKFYRLIHGATQHGQQAVNTDGKPVPLMYYYPTGPIGRLLNALPSERRRRVGAVGLGTGAVAAYARPGEKWTFFEIDPAVVRVATGLGYFTFLATCEGEWEVDLGDARRRLEARADSFDVLILDAFSSDAIPVHLLTREALGVYLSRLSPNGVLAFHISNRYLDLAPLLARLAQERGLALRVDNDFTTAAEAAAGKARSTWVVMARDEAALAPISRDIRWQRQPATPGPVWTDQYSNLLGAWRRDE